LSFLEEPTFLGSCRQILISIVQLGESAVEKGHNVLKILAHKPEELVMVRMENVDFLTWLACLTSLCNMKFASSRSLLLLLITWPALSSSIPGEKSFR
jgi:hypothetical protein